MSVRTASIASFSPSSIVDYPLFLSFGSESCQYSCESSTSTSSVISHSASSTWIVCALVTPTSSSGGRKSLKAGGEPLSVGPGRATRGKMDLPVMKSLEQIEHRSVVVVHKGV